MEKEKAIGALWQKDSEKGTYFSGVIEIGDQKMNIVVFSNNFKKEDKHPDWRIFRQRPREQQPNRMENENPEY